MFDDFGFLRIIGYDCFATPLEKMLEISFIIGFVLNLLLIEPFAFLSDLIAV